MTSLTDLFGEVIHSYTRAQAIDDGVLVDVSETAREAGIRFPVAMTRAAFDDCVSWTEEDAERTGALQDESGRLWDVVNMTRYAITRSRGRTDRVDVTLLRVPTDRKGHRALRARLVAVCGPGDNAEPVITIMLPGES